MASSAIVDAAHRWRDSRASTLIVLASADGDTREGWEPTDDIRALLNALQARGGVGHEQVDWEGWAQTADGGDVAAVLPLMCWTYSSRLDEFRALLSRLCASGARPAADVRVLQWSVHKGFLV